MYFYRYYNYIAIVGMADMRAVRFEVGAVLGSSYEAVFYAYIVGASVWICKFVVALALFFPGVSRFTVTASVVACLCFLGFGAGRNIILEIGLMALFLYLVKVLSGVTDIREKKKQGLVVIAGICALLLSVGATLVRMFPNEAISLDNFLEAVAISTEHFVVYFVGSFRAFEYALENFLPILGYNYGRLALAGIEEIVCYFFWFFGYKQTPISTDLGILLDTPITIGDSVYFNALYTAVVNFYFDFGLFGVFLWGVVFGVVCSLVLRRLERKRSGWDLFVAAVLFSVSMLTPLVWKLTTGPPILLVATGYFLTTVARRRRFASVHRY
jgi:oligosaccharide repeat unit polymerase